FWPSRARRMMPPLASSLPEIGRNRTLTSTSAKAWSSSSATAHGCVSTVWASTGRPDEVRRTQRPVTNFHFGLSLANSSFTVTFPSAAAPLRMTGTSASSASMRAAGVHQHLLCVLLESAHRQVPRLRPDRQLTLTPQYLATGLRLTTHPALST